MSEPIRYSVVPADAAGHLFRVRCRVPEADPAGQLFSLPAWIPGSYMIRDFARNIVAIRAASAGRPLALRKIDKQSWRAAPLARAAEVELEYEVYAWDLSVRSAHLDQTHGFFNGTSLFLCPRGHEARPCLLELRPPAWPGAEKWRVATAMAEARGQPGGARRHGFGLYRSENYDELIDHPVEMGEFALGRFRAGGVAHEVVLTGRHDCDMRRLCDDLARVCAWQVELFGAPAPMRRYLFLATVVGDGYGGLEHRASTALLASRKDLPHAAMKGLPDGYKSFLGLCSHEYFHSWNVKRIRPLAFTPYELDRECHTRLLWAFEGFTSYYDDLALVRSGVIGVADYLGLLGKTIANVLRGPGRLRQSVAESSFDAWTKFYRQDENAPNAIVSYYAKGALVALAADLQLRSASGGERSLDDLMRLLWRRYGLAGQGVPEDGVFEAMTEVGGPRLGRWLRSAVEGTDDLPLARWLKPFGIRLASEAGKCPSLGVKLAAGERDAVCAQVYAGGAAHRAGLAAGDVLVAIDGLRVVRDGLDAMLERRTAGDVLRVHAFRRDELMQFELQLDAPATTTIRLELAVAGARQRGLRSGWLGSPGDA